ncbi:unnamed protein product [Somion occarium]|uniref:Uncharacterized protein n=1 Tax=Somion occarium TaxID=3059160 RepID=A0ABP1CFS7_9APHY
MVSEIKFTSFGIPYLVEFANVKFRAALKRRSAHLRPSRSRSSSSSASSGSSNSSGYVSVEASLATASSETLVYSDERDGEGLYIQFASRQTDAPRPLSETRLARLKHRIANAVLAAGMDTPVASDVSDPMGQVIHRLSQRFEKQSHHSPSSFYRGTYGQVIGALQSAGLTITPCKASGLEDAQRLGSLFVANHTELGTVELTKLTLWA